VENTSILKYTLLLLAAPLWWPVVKALWIEVNRMLADDGGVFGRLPSAADREQVRLQKEALGESLVSDPIYSSQQRASARRGLAREKPSAGANGGNGKAAPPPKRPGAGPPARRTTGFR
jgi:hypothetical protein